MTGQLALYAALLIGVPLFVAGSLLYAATKTKSKQVRVASVVVAALVGAPGLWLIVTIVPYLWAVHLEDGWHRAHPRTRAEMESHLSLYYTEEIQPAQSAFGRSHELAPGEHMTRYMLMWTQPLDVVYDEAGGVVAIYTSYE